MAEIKFNIEDMTRCPGRCEGCLLTAQERSGSQASGVMPWDALSSFCARYVSEIDPDGKLTVSVNFGQGDHLLLSPEEMRQRLGWVRSTFGARAEVFFTAAALSNSDVLASSARALRSAADEVGQSIGVDLVFDPALTTLKSFSEKYKKNIEVLFDLFDSVDLNVNIGPDTVGACGAREFHDFVRGNGFRSVTINFVPTEHTAGRMSQFAAQIFSWLVDLRDFWRRSDEPYNLTYARSMERILGDLGHLEVREVVVQCGDALSRELYIDHAGEIFFTQAMIGDFPLCSRTGYAGVGNVSECDSLDVVKASKRKALQLLARSQGLKACVDCAFLKGCYAGGMLAAAALMDASDECPVGVLPLWEATDCRGGDVYRTPSDLGRRKSSGVVSWFGVAP
jgi:hypothetical protein